jgi:hypothetical protein
VIGWEDIFNEFLEGGLMRADAEALRWRIQLPAQVRAAMDRDLRLADDLGALGGMIEPAMATAGDAIGRITDALGRESEVQAPGHWRWEAGVPTAGRADDAIATEDAALEGRLTDLGKSMPIADGAMERLVKRISEVDIAADLEESAAIADPMRLYPEGEELKIDALAASKDVLPVEPPSGAAEPKNT